MGNNNYIKTELDAHQVIKRSYDELNNRLRVDAQVTATIGEVSVIVRANDGDNIAITSQDGLRTVNVNADGSIDANVAVSAAGGDSILVVGTENGATNGIQHVVQVGADLKLSVKDVTAQASLASIDADIDVALSTRASSLNQTNGTQKTQVVDPTGASVTSQTNGTQRALDVGVNVAGVQVDPRQTRTLTSADTVTVAQPIGTNLHTVVDSSALPTGAATESTLATRVADTTVTARLNTLGQKTSVASAPVVLASDQSVIPVTGPLTDTQLRATAVPISGTVTVVNAAGVAAVNIQDGGNSITVDGAVAATQAGVWDINNVTGIISLPTNAATETTLSTRVADATITARLNTLGQKISTASAPVVLASDQSTLNTNVVDLITRELGRIVSSDILFVSETFNTTSNVASNARPTNGDLNIRRYKSKTIFIRNTSANNGRYSILASVDGGVNYDITIVADVVINNGVTATLSTDLIYTNIRVLTRSSTNGQLTTFVTKAYAIGT